MNTVPSNTVKGIACMIGGSAFLTMNDAVMKWLTASYPVGQLLFIRGLFVFILVAVLAHRFGGLAAIRVRSFRDQAGRAVLMVASSFLFVTGLVFLPLADATAIAFAAPLFVTALAPPLLGESVGWRLWVAVSVGFAGVVLMVQPTAGAVRWAALLPLGAALSFGLANIVTRRISARESSVAMLSFTTLAVVGATLTTAGFGWRVPAIGDVALLALAGLLFGCSQFLMIEAFRLAEATLVSPFNYTAMVWAVVLGFLVWGHVPDVWVVSGSILVIGSGLYIWRRGARRPEMRKKCGHRPVLPSALPSAADRSGHQDEPGDDHDRV